MLALLFGTAVAQGQAKPDFANAVYPWVSATSVPQSWGWMPNRGATKVRLNHGSFKLDGSSSGAALTFHSVQYGDLDGDGLNDAAVDLLYHSGGTANWHYLYVYRLQKPGKPQLLSLLESGSRGRGGLARVRIASGTLVLDFHDPARQMGDCCSAGIVRVTYRWLKGQFVEVARSHFDAEMKAQ